MKKYFFVFFLFLSLKSNSQCSLSLDEIISSSKYSISEFENFSLNRGFSYNSVAKNFTCDLEYQKDANQSLTRILNSNQSTTIIYSFFQKSIYLEFKTFLERNGKLVDINNDNNLHSLVYLYNQNIFLLQTATHQKSNVYFIFYSNEQVK